MVADKEAVFGNLVLLLLLPVVGTTEIMGSIYIVGGSHHVPTT